MYVNGLGFRAIERVTGVNHNTVIRWVRKSALSLPNAPEVAEIPEITEIDELQQRDCTSCLASQRASRSNIRWSKSGATPLIFNQLWVAHQDKTKFGYGQQLIIGNQVS